jgi:hypothetical protein
MSGLRIASGFTLPLGVAGEAIAILAKRGAGKTNTATVLVEELVRADVQTVVVDPVGAWWGIRSSAAGEKGAGLSVPILGGQHGDVPLEQTAGALIADVVVDSGSSLLLDLSDFPSKAAVSRFVADFADRLYRRKARASSLLHVVLEEADEFAPQTPRGGWKGDAGRMASAVEQIVRRGRSRGLGVTLITQRSAVLNKDVLTQTDVLVVMRTTGPHDVAAIKLWVDAKGEDDAGVIASLPSLATGEAWVWNPERDLLQRVKVHRRRTFDSSATPKAGERRVEPTERAAIDIEQLGEKIAATAEKAKAEDPRELRRRITALERDLAAKPSGEPVEVERIVEKRVEVPIEVPAVDAESLELLQAIVGELRDIGEAAGALRAVADQIEEGLRHVRDATVRRERAPAPVDRGVTRADRPQPQRPAPRPRHRSEDREAVEGDERLGRGELRILGVLAEFPEGRTQNELAFLTGYSANASTIGVILSKLRRLGLVEPGQPIRPTAEGLEFVGGPVERPTGQALLEQWLQHPRMGEGERRVLLALIDLYPEVPSTDELAEITGYSPTASTIGVILSKLRKLGLVEKGQRRVAEELMEAIEA